MRSPIALVALVACSVPDARDARPAPGLAAPGLRLPDDVTPLHYALRLELDPDVETFRGRVSIRVRLEHATDHFWIHADQLEIDHATFGDGRGDATPLAPVALGDEMRAYGFGRVLPAGDITVELAFTGHAIHDEEGVFRQRDRDRWYMFTQSESVLARRITPCFDEPRFKTPWQVTLVVPAGDVALANTAQVHEALLPDGRREVAFAESPAMPTYLLAAAVGPFELVDAGVVGKRGLPVRVVALRGDRGNVGVVAAQLPAIVDAIEAYLGEPLPWPKLDLVAVPHLFGAMENPGLVTFDADALVGDPAALAQRFVGLAAHELAHQWFGNLVTPAWWDDLWLAEAFATWLGDKLGGRIGTLGTLGRHADPALAAALSREHALEADAAPGAKPLRPVVAHNRDPDTTFGAITYNKGATVLAMFERWLGADAFRAAVRGYIARHRDGIATERDMIDALGDGQLGAALGQYVERVGAPVVELTTRCDGGTARVIAHARDHRLVPVCVRDSAGQRVCAVVGEHTELALAACPAWLVGNDGGLAYYLVVAPTPPVAQLAPAERIAVGDDVAAALARGDLPIAAALAELTALARSRDGFAALAALAIARVVDPVVAESARPAWGAWLAGRFADRLTPAAVLAESASEVDGEVRDALVALVPPDALPPATTRAARDRAAHAATPELAALANDPALCERLANLAHVAKTPDERDAALETLGACGLGAIDRVLEVITAAAAAAPPDAAWVALTSQFDRAATRTAAWRAVGPRVAALIARASPGQASSLFEAVSSLCDRSARTEVAAAFGAVVGTVPDGRTQLDHALAAIDACVARRARLGDIAGALASSR